MSDPVAIAGQPIPVPTSPRRIPWRDIARRLAAGAQPAAIAADLGLQEDRIWRHLRRSLRFRFYLQQALDRQRLLAGLQLAAAAPGALVSRGLQPDSLDGDGLRLLSEAGRPDGGDMARQVEQLGATGDPPPNMAWRARLAVEKRGMDLQAAEASGFVAGLEAGIAKAARMAPAPAAAVTAAASPPRPDPAPAGPRSVSNGTPSAPDGTHSASNGTLSTPDGTHSASNGTQSASNGPDPAVRDPQRSAAMGEARPVSPRPRPAMPHPAEPPRAIVDIDGPDRARLAATGALQRPALPDHAEDG
ncbi:MAG: hypothetical protein OJJ21_05085 [Ferrovibrio sp.]|uniref:hypothetical protein n=1 Tax=Ferrovibrio sp. TaxID=1917215 RepID=UPI002637BC62|nr:hypothetical protein [Ferrovibrio sp.]MCW0232955.1 hypothetical protein [Ferrovibrio sp.]